MSGKAEIVKLSLKQNPVEIKKEAETHATGQNEQTGLPGDEESSPKTSSLQHLSPPVMSGTERPLIVQPPGEIGGPAGPEPTRYGDWSFKGRCSDF